MQIKLEPGTYVMAVSGGVDSMVLLDLASKLDNQQYKFVVAHFEHGIRSDSIDDLHLVRKTAEKHDLPFVFDHGQLGTGASEAKAREARYKFLRRVKQVSGADAIITAHHQDDVLETAILNMLRGTGPRGLGSLKSTDEIIRPLLRYSKQELINYAKKHRLTWHEDSSNSDLRYKRNHIRHIVAAKLSEVDRKKLLALITASQKAHKEIDELLPDIHQKSLNRQFFTSLPHDIAKEVMSQWLKVHHVQDISRDKIERLVVAAKTYKVHSTADVDGRYALSVEKDNLALIGRER